MALFFILRYPGLPFLGFIVGSCAAARHYAQRNAADRDQRNDALESDRSHDLQTGGEHHRIAERCLHGGLRRLNGPLPDLPLAHGIADRSQYRRHEKHSDSREAGLQQAVFLKHEDEGGRTQERRRDEEADRNGNRQRGKP